MSGCLRSTWRAPWLLLVAGALGCGSHSGSKPPAPQESSKVRITTPTTDPGIRVYTDFIDLGGWASIDAWSYSYEVEPNVRWINVTSGAMGEASEHVDWEWFLFTPYPTNHVWSAHVPLVYGGNETRVEAYYSTSGTVIGSDSIQVGWF